MTLLSSLPVYPLIGFLLLIFFGKRLSWLQAAFIGVFSVAISAVVSFYLVYLLSTSEHHSSLSVAWHWFDLKTDTGSNVINIAFYLDQLSSVMIMVVTGIGTLIHLFAATYMKQDKNFNRFMAYMNLFISAMLILVLADNLVLLYLGWEGVGVCSFLLIGFWYQEPKNVIAARKAFIVTRVGDTSLVIGLVLLFNAVGELNIVQVNDVAAGTWHAGESQIYWICLFLLGGAVGKSAQLPLQTWLPDAMAGPTPVSALIHAATMVTAGVYLIARMNPLFVLSPEVMFYISSIGAATLILAGIAALAQKDIKRILAYSTMSQIGYMMLALGAGAWSAAIFHLMTHAFFKALLFLTAGVIISIYHHEQNLFRMGGLYKVKPIETMLLIIGLLCLVAFPGTSGFFSKELILANLWSSGTAGPLFWWLAIIGAVLTCFYSVRLLTFVCLGQSHSTIESNSEKQPGIYLSLLLLAILSLIGGFITLDLSPVFDFSHFVQAQLLQKNDLDNLAEPSWLHTVAIIIPLVSLALAWLYFSSKIKIQKNNTLHNSNRSFSTNQIKAFAQSGLGFDHIYSSCLVKPFLYLAKVNKNDIFDKLLLTIRWFILVNSEVLSFFQNGFVRWYAAVFVVGLILLVGGWLI